MKKLTILLLVLVSLFLLSGCMAGGNSMVVANADLIECLKGFFLGFWHGMISPITFIVSLFTDTVKIYAVNNVGGWYDFGFLLGVGGLFGGGSRIR